jgi:hypothetical protein
MDNEDGKKLATYLKFMMSDDAPSEEDVQRFCEDLNARAVTENTMKEMLRTHPPRTIVLRNSVHAALNVQIGLHMMHQAKNLSKRMIVWRCYDAHPQGKPLSTTLKALLEGRPASDTKNMPTIPFFFPGVTYKFIDNRSPRFGRMNNNLCVGRSIVLDHHEPPDDLTQPQRVLRYLPRAVIVEPQCFVVPPLPSEAVPPNCIPILPTKVTYTLKFPSPDVFRRRTFSVAGRPLF